MLYHFTNKDILNKFNPTFDYYIYEDNLNIDLITLKNNLLILEKDILSNYSFSDDGGTGLSKNSLTTRHSYYNLLQFKQISFLKNIIKNQIQKFLKQLNYDIESNYYVKCWFNVLRKEEQIRLHQHSSDNYGFLSGHICVNTHNTSTYYLTPYTKNVFSSKNQNGKITLFPSWIEHYTDRISNNDQRITIAFDVRTYQGWNEDIKDSMKSHWEKI